jgi:hypothetical protein
MYLYVMLDAHEEAVRGSSAKVAVLRAPAGLRAALDVLGKAGGIFREYVLDLYFPAQRLSRWQRLRCIPLLFLVEYLVYRVDAVAEDTRGVGLDVAGNADYDKLLRYKRRFASLLRRARAHNDVVARQLDLGEQYVRLENHVTSRSVAHHEQIVRLAELRPSDVRLLHGMTFALLGRPVDHDLINLLWPVEVLADIGNDLEHYERDVVAGHFNTYDAFVRLYGRAAPDRLRAEITRYEQLFHAELGKLPADRRDELAALCIRRYRARTEHIPRPQLRDDGHGARPESAS